MHRHQRWVHAMVLFAFTLQAIVPAGFMPAAVSTGQLIKLCPTGLSPELMSILHPQHSMQNNEHQHHGGHHLQSQPENAGMEHGQWRADCPFGAVAPSDLAIHTWTAPSLADDLLSDQQALYSKQFFVLQRLSSQQARAPPSATS
ncbi:MAG: hypothetical protein AB8B48_15930 [Pseudomonadales bacterium]